MYRSIYVPLDNSAHSLRGAEMAIAHARHTGAQLTGSHVYAAKLHDRRFRQMEAGLPEPYLREEKLVEQRDIHDDLITRGLQLISDSYLDVFERMCADAGLGCARVALEGKNWQGLVEDIGAGDYDLVVMGALGLGAVECSQLGSVCERVARRIDRDLVVVRDANGGGDGPIAVALDGSPRSYGGLKTALGLARLYGRPVEAVAAFDPQFHYVAFNSIAGVLSPQAASVFRFKEQERLHEEIIDSGIARIYQGHLDVAARVAAEEGVTLTTRLLAGKPLEQVLRYAREAKPWLLVLGRTGVHSGDGMDLGSLTENLLLSAREWQPAFDTIAETTMSWTVEAEARMGRVPEFVQGLARKAILRFAAERGHTMVTSDVIDACLGSLMPGAGSGAKCPFTNKRGRETAPAGEAIRWEADALARLERIGQETVRNHARLRIEKMARGLKMPAVTAELVDAAQQTVAAQLG